MLEQETSETTTAVTKVMQPKTLAALLSELRHLNIRLWIEDDRLRYKAAKDAMSPDLLAELRDRKNEILEFLRSASQAADPDAVAIPVISRDGDLPLSIAQERFWYHHQFEPNSSLNNIITAYRIKGRLDLELLDLVQHEIVQRHEILRTTFPSVDGKPTVAIATEWQLTIPIEDLQSIPSAERDELAHQRAIIESRRPYDLATGPLLRLRLLQLEPDDYVLVFTMHRMMADGVSVDIVFREIVTLYEAHLLGKPSLLPELPIQYVDYAHWQRQRLQGEFLDRHLSYWKNHLSAPFPTLNLPVSRPRPSTYSFNTLRRRLIFPKRLNEALNNLSQGEEATIFMTLMTAFKVLLYRYSGQEDVIICCSNANRNRSEVEPLVGPFFNTLALRTQLDGNPTFREILQREKQVVLEAFAHQELPFEQLVPELDTSNNRGRSSLFQVFFALNPSWKDGNTLSRVELPEVTFDTMFGYLYTGKTKFDLFLIMREAEEGLQLLFEYNSDLFDSNMILPLMDHFQTLLESIVANPDHRISQLPLLTPAEKEQLLISWDHAEWQYSSPYLLDRSGTLINSDLPKTQLYILDYEHQPIPVGALGELYIDETRLSQGYLNQFELTDTSFIPHPLSNKNSIRLYRTGEIARYRSDGIIELFNSLNRESGTEEQSSQSKLISYVASRDELERQLTQAWEEVLNIQPIGIQDNFFELGGHSLLAVRLFAQIEKILGKQLPLSVLLHSPTIEQLASALREDNDDAWFPLVKIKAGSPDKTALFCIHGGGFNVLIYRDLALNLNVDQPVYGLQAQGLNGRGGVWANSLEDIASDYIREIRSVQPHGPYYLSGLSNGGNIALEMAQQLQAEGEQVALLAMFDSYGPEGIKLLPPLPRFLSSLKYVLLHKVPKLMSGYLKSGLTVILDEVQKIIRTSKSSNDVSRRKTTNLLFSGQKISGREVKPSLKKLPSPDLHEGGLQKGMNYFSRYVLEHSSWSFFNPTTQLHNMNDAVSTTLKQLEESHSEIHKNYVPKSYPGKITLFRATERPPGYWVDPKLGWSTIAKEGVEVYKIPGDHTSLMESSALAKKMEDCLESLQTFDEI